MRKGTLKFNDEELYTKTSADMVTYSDGTVADALQNISASNAETADFATRAEKDSNGNVIHTTYAPIDSPNFTGTPTAPAINDLDLNTNQVATVSFANALIQRLTGVVPDELDTFEKLYNALGQDSNIANTIATQIDAKQDKSDILTALSNLNLSAGKLIYVSGSNSLSLIDCTATGQAVISKTTPKDIRKLLGIYKNPFYDECENNWDKFNEPYTSNANKKFGSKALQTDSGGIINNNRFTFGGADFTIGFFANISSATASWGAIFCACASSNFGTATDRQGDISLLRYDANNGVALGVVDSQNNPVVDTGGLSVDVIGSLHYFELDFHHSTQTIELFVDNQRIFTQSNVTVERLARYFSIGSSTYNWNLTSAASIDEFFILDGVARSSGTCTVPTEPFEVTENTLSLLHFE